MIVGFNSVKKMRIDREIEFSEKKKYPKGMPMACKPFRPPGVDDKTYRLGKSFNAKKAGTKITR